MAVEEAHAVEEIAFKAYVHPLKMISSFKYPGRILSASGNDWPAVVANMWKAWKKWYQISRILGREGGDTRTLGMFYKAVVQVVLLFISDNWVMTLIIGSTLGGFHHWVAHRLTGNQLRRNADRNWW